MATCSQIFWDEEGNAHTDCLYWEGFPRILWDSLRIFHYPDPPQYTGRQFSEDGIKKNRVKMTIPQHPTLEWPPIEIEVIGYRLVDAFEKAALNAITTFCEHHPEEVAAYPIGLFPAVSAGNAEWLFRVTHFGHLIGDVAGETIEAVVRYMNAQSHYQILQQRHMDQVIDLAQSFQRGLRLKDIQIEGLQDAVAGRDTAIAQFEHQAMEHGAEIEQRNIVIGFLQGQVNELQADWDDALAHIGVLQGQLDAPAEPAAADEDPEEMDGVSDLDSEHALAEPNPQPDDSSSGSASSVGNLDDF